jgi:hypothetical protein
MPAPIVPLAWTALRLGAVAAVALYTARGRSMPKDVEHDFVLNSLPEGLAAHPHRAEAEQGMHGHGRLRRTIRIGRGGPGIEIDAALLGHFRLRRVAPEA